MGLIQWPQKIVTATIQPIRLGYGRSRLDRLARLARTFSGLPCDDEIIEAIRSVPVHRSKSNSLENSMLLLIFNNTGIANVGDATGLRGSTTAGSLYLSLHTSDPGEAGDQTTNEISYTSYVRKGVLRASGAGGFTVSADTATLTDALTSFVTGGGGSGTATHFGIGTASSSTGVLLYSGTVTPNIVCGTGITPQLTSATAITEA